jgi:predicted esterase
MKVLCLHGYGTNAAVLENQFQVFFSQANKEIEPLYLEGEVDAPKAGSEYLQALKLCQRRAFPLTAESGLSAFTKGPFFCYYDAFDPASVKKALEFIDEVIQEDGPFDGVLGFSQGGSLAVAYMLQHEVDHPNEPQPFKWACIFSSVIGFTPDARYCEDVIQGLSEDEVEALAKFPDADYELLEPKAKTLFQTMGDALKAGQEGGFLPAHPDEEVFSRGDTSQIPRIIHPDLIKQRVRIPTVHMVGKQDDPLMIAQSKLMYGVCDSAVSKWLEHSGGHDVPRQVQDAKNAVKAMEWAVLESQQRAWASL